LTRQLHRLAEQRCESGDVMGVAFLAKHILTVSNLPAAIARRFPKGF
jgi:hypothetical protein